MGDDDKTVDGDVKGDVIEGDKIVDGSGEPEPNDGGEEKPADDGE